MHHYALLVKTDKHKGVYHLVHWVPVYIIRCFSPGGTAVLLSKEAAEVCQLPVFKKTQNSLSRLFSVLKTTHKTWLQLTDFQ